VTTQNEFESVDIHLSDAHVAAVNRPRRIVLQEDANMPFPAFGLPFDQWMKLRFQHCDRPDSQIDGIWWDIGLAEDTYALYDSALLPKLQLEGLDEWWRQGIDWVGEIVDECHRRGIEAFWNNRVCPVDFPQPMRWSDARVPHEHPSRINPVKKAHPDWTVPCWWPQGLWNLAVPEVRQRKVAILRELLERYPLDGIQLDFARHTPCLPPDREWEHREHATAFVRMVRLMMLDLEERSGRPLLLAARVGETVEGNRLDGFDIEAWITEGLVDILSPGGRTTTIDFDAFDRLRAGRPVKLCAPFDGHHTTDGYHFPPMAYYRGVFRNFWQQGADFVSLFNWACADPEAYHEAGLSGLMDCPSHSQAVTEVGGPAAMADKDRMYVVERRGGYPWAGNFVYRNDDRPLPHDLTANRDVLELPLRIEDDLAHDNSADQITVRLVLLHAPEDTDIDVRLNGHRLTELRRDPAWTDGQIYGDKPQPSAGARGIYESNALAQPLLMIEFATEPVAFVRGINRVAVGSNAAVRIEKAEVWVTTGAVS
jgi:hypothetical protein